MISPPRRLTLAVLLYLSLLPSCSPRPETEPPSNTVARVGSAWITVDALQAEVARRGPERYASTDARRALLDEMIRFEALVQAARGAGYDKDPQVVAAQQRAMVARFRQERVEASAVEGAISDEAIEDAYEAHTAEFARPRRVRVAVIRIDVPANASPEKRAELVNRSEAARAEALRLPAGTPSFGSIAVRYSDDQASRYRGGDVGWLEAGQAGGRWDPEVVEAAFALSRPGALSPVIPSHSGHHVVKLIESQDAARRPFEEVREGIRQRLLADERRKAEAAFLEDILAKAGVTVDEAKLASIPVLAEATAQRPPSLPSR